MPALWSTAKIRSTSSTRPIPAAQAISARRPTRKLVREWGIRYIKMDFMDDSAIEGYYYKPHTTAMEAQRIGLADHSRSRGQ